MRRRLAWLVSAVAIVAGIASVTAGASGSAGRPAGSPDLAAMALAVSDLPSPAKVESQGYYRNPNYTASYERALSLPGVRLGRSRLLLVYNQLSVDHTEPTARSTFATFRAVIGKRAVRNELASGIARNFDVSPEAVTVNRARTVRVGDGAVSVPVRINAEGVTFYAVIVFMRVDRVLAGITFFSFPERRIYDADVDRLARVSATRIKARLVPVPKAPPLVSGTTQPGQTLAVARGTWTGDQLAFAYQWERCDATGAGCALIPGATAPTYTVASGDLASTLRATVVGRNRLDSIATSSVSTSVVAGPPGSPTSTATPLVSGTAQADSSLAVDAGSWGGSPTSFAYQWRRCNATGVACVDIAGATAATYAIAAPDSRSTLRALVVATNASGSRGAISAPTSSVP